MSSPFLKTQISRSFQRGKKEAVITTAHQTRLEQTRPERKTIKIIGNYWHQNPAGTGRENPGEGKRKVDCRVKKMHEKLNIYKTV